MEQILIRNLPAGTKARLRARARHNRHSVEAEARALLTSGLSQPELTLVDLISTCDGAEIDFEPERLGVRGRDPEL